MVRLGIRSIWASNLSQPKHPSYIWIGWGPLIMKKEEWSGLGWSFGSTQKVMEALVAQSPSLRDSMNCRSPGSSVHGVSQIRILECVSISFPRGYSHLMDGTQVSCIAGRSFTIWVTREAQGGSTQVSLKADISKPSITKVLFPKWMTHLLRTAVLRALSYIIHIFFPNLLH